MRIDIGFRAGRGRHFACRQWTGRRVSRKAARTARTPEKLRVSRPRRFEAEDSLASRHVSGPPPNVTGRPSSWLKIRCSH
jgi:hypothetical protein